MQNNTSERRRLSKINRMRTRSCALEIMKMTHSHSVDVVCLEQSNRKIGRHKQHAYTSGIWTTLRWRRLAQKHPHPIDTTNFAYYIFKTLPHLQRKFFSWWPSFGVVIAFISLACAGRPQLLHSHVHHSTGFQHGSHSNGHRRPLCRHWSVSIRVRHSSTALVAS